jgi:hypothetical protein
MNLSLLEYVSRFNSLTSLIVSLKTHAKFNIYLPSVMLHSFRIYILKITPSLSEISSYFKGINRSVGNIVIFKAVDNLCRKVPRLTLYE